MSSWHKYGGIGHDSKFKNLMSNNLASNEIAKMNKLYANNICVAHDVDVSGNVYVDGTVDISGNLDLCGNAVIDGTLDVSGHSQLCDVSACNVDISQNLRVDGSANFTTGRIDFPRVFDTTGSPIGGNLFLGALAGHNFGINHTGENTALGRNAMANSVPDITNCSQNTAVGERSGTNISNTGILCNSNTTIGVDSLTQLNIGSNNVGIGFLSGRHIVSDLTANNSTYLGANTNVSASGVTNENVIGEGATGKGSNTVQIGNCDITDVYLGCDGSGTTLHVDDISMCDLSACNVDISQNLRAGIEQFTSPLIGAGEIKNPRVYVANSPSGGSVIVGSQQFWQNPGIPNLNNTVLGNSIKQVGGQADNSVFVGHSCGRGLDYLVGGLVGNSCYVGMTALSGGSGSDSITNETVIGYGARGKGSNTVQIGNCDVSDVYLGCDGSGTTLHVDDISASNVDISGSLTVEGVDFFKVRPIPYIDVSATDPDLSANQILTISSELIRDYPIINLNTGAGRDGIITYNLSNVDSNHNPTLEGRKTTFGTEFVIVGSGLRTTKLVFNTGITDTVTPREVSWVGKSIGGTRLTWDGGAWSVADCFNQSTVTSGTGASLI